MRAAWAIGLIVAVVGCHRDPEVQPWPARELGDYSYRIAATPVYGKFTIQSDTVTLEAQQHACRRIASAPDQRPVHYFRCTGGSTVLNVTVNSWRPILSTWSAFTTVKSAVEICMQYETTKTGRRVCKSSRTEMKTDTVRTGGTLEITRIASADRP